MENLVRFIKELPNETIWSLEKQTDTGAPVLHLKYKSIGSPEMDRLMALAEDHKVEFTILSREIGIIVRFWVK